MSLGSHTWQAEEYHSNSKIQSEAAFHLLQYVQFKGSEQVLDIGCGDGKITAKIANFLTTGSIIGIDISPDMIGFAKGLFPNELYRNMTFLLQDAQTLNYKETFDVVFSSFAIQWIKDFNSFFGRVYKSLKPSGLFAATIPLGISSALEESIHETTSLEKWASFFINFPYPKKLATDEEYARFIALHGFRPIRHSAVLQETVFSSREKLEKYIIQWFPYLQPLPENLKAEFFREIVDKYLEIELPLPSGEILFRFPRLDVIAYKEPIL